MNISQAGASRSRDVGSSRAFLLSSVISAEPSGSSASPYGWKFTLSLRIWTEEGPKGYAAKCVLATLLVNSDERGRTWLSVHAIMNRTGLRTERTVRAALDALVRDGWITSKAQTWSSLTAEQLALGRKTPRRGDLGQAPNLYTVLASPSPHEASEVPTRPGLTKTTENPAENTPLQKRRGGPLRNDTGGPPAFLHPDPYPLGSVSNEVREERETRSDQGTHLLSKSRDNKGEWAWLDAWKLLERVHFEKTKTAYGVAPLSPDLKRDDRRAVAECLDGTATELGAKLRARGIEREFVHVREELATRVMSLYFKRDNEHLRRVKHALRDLPREFHARLTEATQLILRESHDATVPRRTPVLELEQTPDAKAEKPVETAKIDAEVKPIPAQTTSTTSTCARQLLQVLGAASPKEVSRPKSVESADPPSMPRASLEASRSPVQESAQERSEAPSPVQRSIGRPGAPRWGELAPTPMKIRRVSRLQVVESDEPVESIEPHPRE